MQFTPTAGPTARPRSRSWRMALLLSAVPLALLAGEAGYRGWLRARGTPYDGEATRAWIERAVSGMTHNVPDVGAPIADAASEEAPGTETVGPKVRHVLHPFLGFDVEDGSRSIARELARQRRRPPEEFTVVVLGGSVAAGFAKAGAVRLAAILQDDPRLRGRSVRVVNFGRGGFKQPQQLLLLAHLFGLGYRPHAVVNLDGFNEVALGNYNADHRVHPAFPSVGHWVLKSGGSWSDPNSLDALLAMRTSEEAATSLARRVLDRGLHHSAVLGTAARARIERLRADWDDAQERFVSAAAKGAIEPSLRGPPFPRGTEAGLRLAVGNWMECSISLRALCAARGVAYLHVLQPTLHDEGSKPLTAEERARSGVHPTWLEGARKGYPLLRAAGRRLARRGVPFLDASRVFADFAGPLYVDSCHFVPQGHEILAESVAHALLRSLDDA